MVRLVLQGERQPADLGDGTLTDRWEPTKVDLEDVVDVSASSGDAGGDGNNYFTCALTGEGRVYCWGDNTQSPALGIGTQLGDFTTPQLLDSISDVVDIGCGKHHCCAVLASGEVRCWGENQYGQLGTNDVMDRATPAPVVNIDDAIQVTGGRHSSCASHRSGKASCWGREEFSELGNGDSGATLIPNEVIGATDVTVVDIGSWRHACALTSRGTVYCWGRNAEGATGVGRIDGALSTAQELTIVEGAHGMAVGQWFSCAVATANIWCWGNGDQGQLGNGMLMDQSLPTPVALPAK